MLLINAYQTHLKYSHVRFRLRYHHLPSVGMLPELPFDLWQHIGMQAPVLLTMLQLFPRNDWTAVAATKVQTCWRQVRPSWDRKRFVSGDRVLIYGKTRRLYGVVQHGMPGCAFTVRHFSPFCHISYYPDDLTLAYDSAWLRIRRLHAMAPPLPRPRSPLTLPPPSPPPPPL